MRARCLLVSALAALSFGSAANVARADEDPKRAARAFHEGQRAYNAGDFRHAAESFEDAFRAKPHHDAMWNAARSWQKAGELARAATDYARYLDIAPAKALDRDHAQTALSDLSQKLGRVEVHTAGSSVRNVRVDGAKEETPIVYVAPGDHVAEADSSAGPLRKVFNVAAGDSASVTLAPAPKPDEIVNTQGPSNPPPPIEKPVALSKKPLPSVVVYVGGGLALVASGLAVWQGLETVSAKSAFESTPTQANLNDARATELRTNIAIASGAGIALLTGVAAIFLVDWGGSEKTTVGFGPRGISLTHNF